MTKLFFLPSLALAVAFPVAAQNIAGDWLGTLSAGGAELRIALHFKADKGSYTGTLDSLDQGANGIPISSVTVKDGKLTFAVDAVQGSYEGKLNADATAVDGIWSQGGNSLPLVFKRGAAPKAAEHKPAPPSDIDGAWEGTVDMGQPLRLVMHVTNTQDGLVATLDSPDQGASGIPATSVKRDGAAITVEVKSVGGGYQAKLNKDLTVMDGTWTQMGNSAPLVLKKKK